MSCHVQDISDIIVKYRIRSSIAGFTYGQPLVLRSIYRSGNEVFFRRRITVILVTQKTIVRHNQCLPNADGTASFQGGLSFHQRSERSQGAQGPSAQHPQAGDPVKHIAGIGNGRSDKKIVATMPSLDGHIHRQQQAHDDGGDPDHNQDRTLARGDFLAVLGLDLLNEPLHLIPRAAGLFAQRHDEVIAIAVLAQLVDDESRVLLRDGVANFSAERRWSRAIRGRG
jgi:hypothetical protein